jgi:nucleotide-binding universal stress UspA family protein
VRRRSRGPWWTQRRSSRRNSGERRGTSGRFARRPGDHGLVIDSEVREGRAAETLAWRAGRLAADLIAMTTHGRGGLGRPVFGSVADEVLRTAPCPILLVRVSDESREPGKGG